MAQYINNGHYSNQTIEEINMRINESNGVVSAAPSTPANTETANTVEETVETNLNATDPNPEMIRIVKLDIWFIGGIAILIIFICAFVIIRAKKRKN